MLCKKDAALWCAWALFLCLWFICTVFMGRGFEENLEGLIRCITLIYGLVLFAASLMKAYKSTLPLWCKFLITIAIALLLYIHVMGFLPVRSVTVTPEQSHIVILPE